MNIVTALALVASIKESAHLVTNHEVSPDTLVGIIMGKHGVTTHELLRFLDIGHTASIEQEATGIALGISSLIDSTNNFKTALELAKAANDGKTVH